MKHEWRRRRGDAVFEEVVETEIGPVRRKRAPADQPRSQPTRLRCHAAAAHGILPVTATVTSSGSMGCREKKLTYCHGASLTTWRLLFVRVHKDTLKFNDRRTRHITGRCWQRIHRFVAKMLGQVAGLDFSTLAHMGPVMNGGNRSLAHRRISPSHCRLFARQAAETGCEPPYPTDTPQDEHRNTRHYQVAGAQASLRSAARPYAARSCTGNVQAPGRLFGAPPRELPEYHYVLIATARRSTHQLVDKTATRLKLIAQTGRVKRHRGLQTRHCRGRGVSSPVAPAELTWALIMAAMRRLPHTSPTSSTAHGNSPVCGPHPCPPISGWAAYCVARPWASGVMGA